MKATRNTIQRGLVLNAVRELKNHPTAEEIYQLVARKHPHISRGTVYRNLNLLSNSGEIFRVEVPNAADRFDFTVDNHYHTQCTLCGKVSDVEFNYLQDLCTEVQKSSGFQILGHKLSFFGICPECQRLNDYEQYEKEALS